MISLSGCSHNGSPSSSGLKKNLSIVGNYFLQARERKRRQSFEVVSHDVLRLSLVSIKRLADVVTGLFNPSKKQLSQISTSDIHYRVQQRSSSVSFQSLKKENLQMYVTALKAYSHISALSATKEATFPFSTTTFSAALTFSLSNPTSTFLSIPSFRYTTITFTPLSKSLLLKLLLDSKYSLIVFLLTLSAISNEYRYLCKDHSQDTGCINTTKFLCLF